MIDMARAVKKTYTVNSAPGLNVRKYADLSAPVLRILQDGAKVSIDNNAETEKGWKKLIDGGYVVEKYIK